MLITDLAPNLRLQEFQTPVSRSIASHRPDASAPSDRARAARPWRAAVSEITTSIFAIAAFALFGSSPSSAQQTVPVTLDITELWQLSDIETPPNLADVYPVVLIDGQSTSNTGFECDDESLQSAYLLPIPFLSEGGYVNPTFCTLEWPWTFTVDVPVDHFDSDGIPIQIKINDEDAVFDDELETVDLVLYGDGTWSGAANWPQNCNQEATGGEGARVCWQIKPPIDSDGDGLSDLHEQIGMDTDGDDMIDLDLPAMGANPLHKDIFLELDWTARNIPSRRNIQKVIDTYAQAPVDSGGVANPDGQPGITLHVDTGSLTEDGLLVGENLGGGNQLGPEFDVCGLTSHPGDYYFAKDANFDFERRRFAFHYGALAVRCCRSGSERGKPCEGHSDCADNAFCTDAGGIASIGGSDLTVWSQTSPNDLVGFQGATLMHELGHNLHLLHGGDEAQTCKPNYVSLMNYFRSQRLTDGSYAYDFSPALRLDGTRGVEPVAPLAEDALDETSPIDATNLSHLIVYSDSTGRIRSSPIGEPVDSTGEEPMSATPVTVNVDLVPGLSECAGPDNTAISTAADPITSHDDWRNLRLPFLTKPRGVANAPVVSGPIDPTDEEVVAHLEEVNTADLGVTQTAPTGPVEAGVPVDLDYQVAVRNAGPNPAVVVGLLDDFPTGSLLSGFPLACSEDPASSLACRLPMLRANQATDLEFSVRAQGRCEGGLPVPIVSQATTANITAFAGADPNPADNSSTASVPVVDTTAPALEVSVRPTTLWSPNHRLTSITVTATSTDACDANATIRLVSVTSNQPENSTGDGNTKPDIKSAAIGTPDRRFFLRAERNGNDARVYTITYEARDASGNVATRSATVTVPADQS